LIGHELLENDLNQSGILLLSGRIGFELVQKAIMAGFSSIVALGAPSNLAIQAANQFDIALIGFAKDERFNLYTAHHELIG
ncbi:MAG: formate dehydrogenase accessory sulfurtransferase FdhD, partial [Kangiellaceae bacterium]|nr:formate dehydrogenase accessory sulfurtransferase FdhD [Kangiellaceae bacterium]